MFINISVVPRAKERKIDMRPDGSYKVWLNSPPEDGRANDELIEILAEHFNLPPSHIEIVRGATSRKKVIKISG